MKRFYTVLVRLLSGLGALILLLLSGLMAKQSVRMNPENGDISLRHHNIGFFCVILLMLIILAILQPLLKKTHERMIFIFCSALYILVGAYFIFCADTVRVGDPSMIMSYVIQMTDNGDLQGLSPDRYLGFYPYLMGFLNYERVLWRLFPDERFLFSVNLAWVLIIFFLLWRIERILLAEQDMVRKNGIVFLFCFFPLFFMMFFLYGTIPGLGFSVLSYYCYLMSERCEYKGCQLLLKGISILSMAMAVWVKPNYLIFSIAWCICRMIRSVKKRDSYGVLFTIMLLIIPMLVHPMESLYYRYKTGYPIEGIPIAAEIATGLQENEGGAFYVGKYNGYEYDVYETSHFDASVAKKEALGEISARLHFFIENPSYASDFFLRKLKVTWNEPTFESIIRGPAEAIGAVNDSEIMQSLYQGDWAFFFYDRFMDGYVFLLYLLSFCFYLRREFVNPERIEAFILFPCIYLIGGMLYHLAGESESVCVVMYVLFLTIPASWIFTEAIELWNIGIKRLTSKEYHR